MGGGGKWVSGAGQMNKHVDMAVALSHTRQTRADERRAILPCPLQPCDHCWFFPRWNFPSVVGPSRRCSRTGIQRRNLIFETPVTWQTRRCGRRLRKEGTDAVEGAMGGGGGGELGARGGAGGEGRGMRCRCGKKCCAQYWGNQKDPTSDNAGELLQPSRSSVIAVRLQTSRLFSPGFFFLSGTFSFSAVDS